MQRISSARKAQKMIISAMNIRLRPKWSDIPPRPDGADQDAEQAGGADEALLGRQPISNSRAISGSATPVMNTTKPSKNLPAAASAQMRHCIAVIGADFRLVPSGQIGQFVDILLHRFGGGWRGSYGLCDIVHSVTPPQAALWAELALPPAGVPKAKR